MKCGICMAGLEGQFERALLELVNARQPFVWEKTEPFVYCEIGTAHGDTWLSVCRLLAASGATWRTVGIDPWIYAFEEYQKKIAPEFGPDKALLLVQTREQAFATEKERIGDRLDFVFIDGCHTKRCVMGDFLAVEPLVVPGGLVVFHDYDSQDKGLQTHCGLSENGVLSALLELGLTTNSRAGWNQLPNWIADASKNGANCGVFEKV